QSVRAGWETPAGGQEHWTTIMKNTVRTFTATLSISALATVGLLVARSPAYAQTQGMERRDDRRDDRQDARDTRQTGREEARDAKEACRDGDNSRSDCRQEKRDTKQDARESARDIKRND
ncbi:MAG TPA: hypothetical protein VFO62_06025, partial [Candidatus Binatia bacterium]|nr:hypothetical protein [Candidatus Binatia bacterium]